MAVVVEVGLDAPSPPSCPSRPGLLGHVLERPVAAVAVEHHRHRVVPGREQDVEQAVVVEVVQDGPARLVEAVDADGCADVAEPADVELRLRPGVEPDQEPRIDLVRVFAERHVRDVQQPADLEVVGEDVEVLGEVLDRQPRALRHGVEGGRRDREDAGALAAAHDAVLGLAAAERGHALVVDDGVEPVLRGLRLVLAIVWASSSTA